MIRVGPESSDWCPHKKRRGFRPKHIEKAGFVKTEGCSAKPTNASSHQKLEGARGGSHLAAGREGGPTGT